MRYLALAVFTAVSLLAAPVAIAGETPSPAGAAVYFIAPADGAMVSSPVAVKFGLKGMGVAPAGIEKAKTGHHDLLINIDPPKGEDLDYSLPADDNVRHFGGGQTETMVDLPKGTHTLQLLLGDANHIPHNPPVLSQKITITVK
jgi:hypothetical protein